MTVKAKADCRGKYVPTIKGTIKNIRHIEDIEHFMRPSLDDVLPLEDLVDIDKGYQIVKEGLEGNKKFLVHFDVDVDGVTSGTQMYKWLKEMDADVEWIINEGKKHGIVEPEEILSRKPDILIVVDSLDSNDKNYRMIADKDVKILVLDHHNIPQTIDYDNCITLISSQKDYKNPNLSGAGVVFKFCKYLDQKFNQDIAEDFYDLCAVGLVSDMMDVSEYNYETRALINEGLNRVNNPAIQKIKGSYAFDSKAISFSVAPKVNSAMRMNENETAAKLFLADDKREAGKLIKKLDECKTRQNEMIAENAQAFEEQCEEQSSNKIIVIEGQFMANFSGLIGNKLASKYKKPIIIVSQKPDGSYAGSGRSYDGLNLNQLVWKTKVAKAFGHDEAFGVFVNAGELDTFIEKINKLAPNQSVNKNIECDLLFNPGDIDDNIVDLVKSINRISGQGFPPLTVSVTTEHYRVEHMGKEGQHLKLVTDEGLWLIKWNVYDPEVFEQFEFMSLMNVPVTVVGTLDRGFFGRTYNRRIIVEEMEYEDFDL